MKDLLEEKEEEEGEEKKGEEEEEPGAKRHHMVSGTLAPLYSFWVKVGLKRGSGPDRGRSSVEWGDFPYVRSFVCTYVRWAVS